jgi:hypothetical protein
MSKLLEKHKDIIHVVIELVVLTVIAYIFNSKIQKLSSEVKILNLRIEEQDKKFKEYDRIIYSLTKQPCTQNKSSAIFKENSSKQNVKDNITAVKEIFIERKPIDIPINIPKTQCNLEKNKEENKYLYNDSSETTSDLDAELEKELQELQKDQLISPEIILTDHTILKIENEQIQKNIQETLENYNTKDNYQHTSKIQSPVLIPNFETLHDNFQLNKEKSCENSYCEQNSLDNYNQQSSDQYNEKSNSRKSSRESRSRRSSRQSSRPSSDKDIQEVSTADMEEYNPNFREMIFEKSN